MRENSMKKPVLMAGLLATALLSGCATDGHFRTADGTCWTCVNSPMTGKPINHDGEHKEKRGEQGGVIINETVQLAGVTIIGEAQTNVDLAYIKIKQEFNFKTKGELANSNYTSDKYKQYDGAYGYEAVPGTYYMMADSYNWGAVRFELEQAGETRTIMAVSYKQLNKMSPESFKDQLTGKINRALNANVAFTEKK